MPDGQQVSERTIAELQRVTVTAGAVPVPVGGAVRAARRMRGKRFLAYLE